MGDECCFLLCLISKKRQVFGVHVMIEAPVNTCSQKINVKFFPTPSSSIKRKKNPKCWSWKERSRGDITLPLYQCQQRLCHYVKKKLLGWMDMVHNNTATRVEPYFHVFYTRFWPYRPNITAEFETHQTRQLFFSLVLSNFGEIMWTVASVCSS